MSSAVYAYGQPAAIRSHQGASRGLGFTLSTPRFDHFGSSWHNRQAIRGRLRVSCSNEAQTPSASPLTQLGRASLITALTLLQALAPVDPGRMPPVGPLPAEAVLNSPEVARLPRTGEVALRRAIPAVNPTMKTVQGLLEDIFVLLRIPQRKPYGTMEGNTKKAIQLATADKSQILAAVPPGFEERGAELYNKVLMGRGGLEGLLASIQAQDPDKVSIRLASALDSVGELESLQASGLPYPISAQFSALPRLTGRAVAQLLISRPPGTSFIVQEGGGGQQTGLIEITLDGYSAPLTAGHFANLIQQGAYTGIPLTSTSQALLVKGKGGTQELPLEILPTGEVAPIYRTPLDVQDGEIPVLPLSVFGSVAMSHAVGNDTNSSPSEFFFYLYDKRNSGLGGLSFEEGQFSVFGYVIKGRELLSQIKNGDIIESAKLISGEDKLVIPL